MDPDTLTTAEGSTAMLGTAGDPAVADRGTKGAPQLTIAGRTFRSRLIIGTGKYDSPQTMMRCLEESGAEMITVAVRRVKLDRADEESLLHWLDPERVQILPNTAG